MKVIAILLIEIVSLLALASTPSENIYWIPIAMGGAFFMGVLLLFDRTSSFVLFAGILITVDLLVGALLREFSVLQLWSLLGIGIFSTILGVAATGQSRTVREIVYLDEAQERILFREVLRSIGISILAISVVMILSLGVLSLTFLAEAGISSAAAMAALAIIAMASLGALVSMRERI